MYSIYNLRDHKGHNKIGVIGHREVRGLSSSFPPGILISVISTEL